MWSTPQKDAGDESFEGIPETPGPVRAKVNHLTKQVSELVGKEHAAMRRHKAEVSMLENKINAQKAQLAGTETALGEVRTTLAATQKELAKCKLEGNTMRDELNLFSLVQQQKALLALAEEQVHVVEMEQRLVQAETQRVMRDHKIALFQAREADLLQEIADRDAQLDALEASNTSTASALADQLRAEKATLETKVDKLETSVKSLKEKEREAREELDGWLKEEKGKSSGVDKEKKDLQIQLRSTKSELQRKIDEMTDLQEEINAIKEASREREKALRAKIKAVYEEHGRSAAVDDDSPPPAASKRPAASPVKKAPAKSREKVRKASPVIESDDESPRKKGKKAEQTTTKKTGRPKAPASNVDSETDEEQTAAEAAKKRSPVKKAVKPKEPLAESASENVKVKKAGSVAAEKEKTKTAAVPKIVVPDEELQEEEPQPAAVEKKKKRKLLGVQPTFAWDPILGSGDGVIPTSLSPMKPASKTVGTIPRLGFPSMTNSRSFGRF